MYSTVCSAVQAPAGLSADELGDLAPVMPVYTQPGLLISISYR
jgi:hypothetical protein